ncbi:hypothetical protein [Sphaerotilus uruguayifluvii]|uniref:Uncharacterized protein n=1 Tax=Sphaerotilus uruguayifluvii TaxID=2735897 RepID=A0ABX2G160_9BURK|nr:hypothetical protein [Leptothrix sp. C29]NRT56043.1 hypothetical protein [Leptothrix sp. C29]
MTTLSGPSSRPPVHDGDEDHYETQIQRSVRDYLDEPADIGRPVGNNTRELFVSCEPAEALQQQFEFLRPSYIVLHDIASRGARRMLHAVAAAAGRPVERLNIRRQSYGTTLAAIDHVDCPARHGHRVRIYSTDIDADSPKRSALARVLLSQAALAVVLVGDLPQHAIGDALQPLREMLFHPGWQCRHLQLMPLSNGSHAAMNGLIQALGLGSGLDCRLAAPVTRPAEAWAMVSARWNEIEHLRRPDGQGALLAPFAPAGGEAMQPMPPTSGTAGGERAPLAAQSTPMERFALELHALNGVQAACVFDIATSRVIAHAGAAARGADLARRGSLLLAAGNSTRRQLQIPGQADEVLVMGGTDALGVRTLVSQPGLAMHLVYRPTQTSWMQLRPRLMALDAALPRTPVL